MTANESDFRIVSKLGEGSFAEVFKVRSNQDGNFYAVKRLKKRYRSIEEVNRLPEILYLKQLQGNPNIIDLKDLIYDQNNGFVAIVFELMDCNLYEFLGDYKQPFEEDVSLLLIYQLLLSVRFLHSKNMFHRDIKPENCMVNKDTYLLKLCDFGSTRAVSSSAPYSEYVSTRWYRAPECILTFGSYGQEVDEWAAGCMLFELLTGKPLFPGRHEIDQIYRIHNLLGTPTGDVLAQFKRNPNTKINFQFQKRPAQDMKKLLPKISDDTIDLLMKLLTYNPVDRITASEALQHPAFDIINQYYEEWQKNVSPTSSMPFSAYYMQTVHGFKYPSNQFSKPNNHNQADINNINTKLLLRPNATPKQENKKHQHVYQPQPPSTKHNKPINPLTKAKYQSFQTTQFSQLQKNPVLVPNQPQNQQNLYDTSFKPKPKIPNFNPQPPAKEAVMEARMKNAQRLKEYENLMKSVPAASTLRKPAIGGFAPVAPQPPIYRQPYKPSNFAHLPPPRSQKQQQQIFQMPKPEILKPRLPPQYKIMEKKPKENSTKDNSQQEDQPSHLPRINQ